MHAALAIMISSRRVFVTPDLTPGMPLPFRVTVRSSAAGRKQLQRNGHHGDDRTSAATAWKAYAWPPTASLRTR
jgi:hypothetical protein